MQHSSLQAGMVNWVTLSLSEPWWWNPTLPRSRSRRIAPLRGCGHQWVGEWAKWQSAERSNMGPWEGEKRTAAWDFMKEQAGGIYASHNYISSGMEKQEGRQQWSGKRQCEMTRERYSRDRLLHLASHGFLLDASKIKSWPLAPLLTEGVATR